MTENERGVEGPYHSIRIYPPEGIRDAAHLMVYRRRATGMVDPSRIFQIISAGLCLRDVFIARYPRVLEEDLV